MSSVRPNEMKEIRGNGEGRGLRGDFSKCGGEQGKRKLHGGKNASRMRTTPLFQGGSGTGVGRKKQRTQRWTLREFLRRHLASKIACVRGPFREKGTLPAHRKGKRNMTGKVVTPLRAGGKKNREERTGPVLNTKNTRSAPDYGSGLWCALTQEQKKGEGRGAWGRWKKKGFSRRERWAFTPHHKIRVARTPEN